MGMYLNPGNSGFEEIRNSRYVDKSGLISLVNRTIGTKQKLTCVSRPRRFGKSFAAQMLCAYYDRSCDSSGLFGDLAVATDESAKGAIDQIHRKQYPEVLKGYGGDALLVGIGYEKDAGDESRKHTCRIEKVCL